ncbi:hypothetical protein HanRHA438_Chr07g0316761 [Helianthus annuus]|nr:hypothetical protein HanRHA438_Chr07g0316761 [Helianthus annuus]
MHLIEKYFLRVKYHFSLCGFGYFVSLVQYFIFCPCVQKGFTIVILIYWVNFIHFSC